MPTTIGGATTESASQQGNLPPGGGVPPATNNSGQNNMHTQPPEISRPQHGSPSFSPHNDPVSTPPDPPPADNNVLNQPDIAAEVDDDDTLHPIRTAVPSSASRQLNFGTAEEAPDQSPLAAALNASTFPIMNPNHLSYQQDDNNLPIATVVGTSLHPLPSANRTSSTTNTNNNNGTRTSPRRPRRVDYQSLNNGAATAFVREELSPQIHTASEPFTKPPRFNQNVGTNAIISCRIDSVYPKKPLKEHYLNSYDAKKRVKFKFRVVGLEKRKTTGNRIGVVLMLSFINDEGPTNTNHQWYVSYTQCKIIE